MDYYSLNQSILKQFTDSIHNLYCTYEFTINCEGFTGQIKHARRYNCNLKDSLDVLLKENLKTIRWSPAQKVDLLTKKVDSIDVRTLATFKSINGETELIIE